MLAGIELFFNVCKTINYINKNINEPKEITYHVAFVPLILCTWHGLAELVSTTVNSFQINISLI